MGIFNPVKTEYISNFHDGDIQKDIEKFLDEIFVGSGYTKHIAVPDSLLRHWAYYTELAKDCNEIQPCTYADAYSKDNKDNK